MSSKKAFQSLLKFQSTKARVRAERDGSLIRYMKKVFILPVMALALLFAAPSQSYALSCIDPEGMIEYIVSNPDYLVVTAKPTQQAEHVKSKALKGDPNQMYDTGYSAQFLNISKAHMGTVPDRQWVYFLRDGTWNYLCAGAPPKIGSENIYVIDFSSNLFQPQTVVAVYPVDSVLAGDLLDAIADTEDLGEPTVYEVSKADWVTRLHDELKEMAFILKVKLAEWQFWKAKVK